METVNDLKSVIAKNLIKYRKENGLTQQELAEKLNYSDKSISKWERGVGCPDVSILEILSKELDCSILEILKGRKIENEIIKVSERLKGLGFNVLLPEECMRGEDKLHPLPQTLSPTCHAQQHRIDTER